MKLLYCKKCLQMTNHEHDDIVGWYCLKCVMKRTRRELGNPTHILVPDGNNTPKVKQIRESYSGGRIENVNHIYGSLYRDNTQLKYFDLEVFMKQLLKERTDFKMRYTTAFDVLKNNPDKWFTSNELSVITGITNIGASLKRLRNTPFVVFRRALSPTKNTLRYEYKYNKESVD